VARISGICTEDSKGILPGVIRVDLGVHLCGGADAYQRQNQQSKKAGNAKELVRETILVRKQENSLSHNELVSAKAYTFVLTSELIVWERGQRTGCSSGQGARVFACREWLRQQTDRSPTGRPLIELLPIDGPWDVLY
jgi:hypothetical protein